MADLIDRQALLEWFNNWSDYDEFSVRYIVGIIKEQPSAERHGKWIHDGYDFPHGVDWMHCSECGKRDVYCPATRTNFCPNCGARMDGEHDG